MFEGDNEWLGEIMSVWSKIMKLKLSLSLPDASLDTKWPSLFLLSGKQGRKRNRERPTVVSLSNREGSSLSNIVWFAW